MVRKGTFIWIIIIFLCCGLGLVDAKLQLISKHSNDPTKQKAIKQALENNSEAAPSNHESLGHHASMSITSLIINIVADLCPHGMLPLAFGLASGPTGLVPAFSLLIIFGLLSASTMTMLAKLAEDTKSVSISEIWSKLVGSSTSWIADTAVASLCFGCCVFYSAFIGDIFSALASAVGVTGFMAKRWVVLGIITVTTLLPLCQLEDISALAFSSILGVAGITYTVLFHFLRYFDNTYILGSPIVTSLLPKLRPSWPSPKYSLWGLKTNTLTLVNMLCVAYLAHYNAINYYKELDNPTMERYQFAINVGFFVAISVFAAMMILGYNLFGSSSLPLILNNFHKTDDLLATFARLATGLAIAFAYPLMFAGLKASLKTLVGANPPSSPHTIFVPKIAAIDNNAQTSLSFVTSDIFKSYIIPAIVTAITAIAMKCSEDDVSLVLGIVGSVLGCSVAYVMPGFLKYRWLKARKYSKNSETVSIVPELVSQAYIALGIVFSVLGVWVTLSTAGSHHI